MEKTQTKENLDGNNVFYIRFKSYRQYLKKVIKNNLYCKGNMKKTWDFINEIQGKAKESIKASFVINGQLVEDKRKISNEFNNFFASVAKKLNIKIQDLFLNPKC